MVPQVGCFYEFHRDRAISRPGQLYDTRTGIEIGPPINKEDAFRRAKAGKDVYTLAKEDAYRMALQLNFDRAILHPAHHPPEASPTGRKDVYFRHFHPGGDGGQFGHIFFGKRGEEYS